MHSRRRLIEQNMGGFVMRHGLLIVVLMAGAILPACGQAVTEVTPGDHASFDVATVRLSDPNSQRQGFDSEGHRMTVFGQTLKSMMIFAYQLHKEQIVGGPGWMAVDKYDIDGIADQEGELDLPQMQEMLRKLLADRFGLTCHHERRQMTYYALVIAKSGYRLTKSAALDDKMPHEAMNSNLTRTEAKFKNDNMSDFALSMQYFSDKPVLDETNLKGRFDFILMWRPDDTQTTESDGPPMLFTAIEEQLGLKLLPKKGLVDVIVVDKLERPSAN